MYCGRQPLLARLRPANIDGAAGALEAVEQLVGQIRTRSSWSRGRRVVAEAEQTGDNTNPRFVVTSLPGSRHRGALKPPSRRNPG